MKTKQLKNEKKTLLFLIKVNIIVLKLTRIQVTMKKFIYRTKI